MHPRWRLIALRTFFAALSLVSAKAAGRIALHLFRTPQRHHRPGWEKQIAERGAPLRVGSNLAARVWTPASARGGDTHDPPTVLLVHGWEGRGTQLGRFVDPFVDAGFRVVALDNPAHGESSGSRTDLIESTEALRKVGREIGPLAGVVAHSFGGAITTLALERGFDTTSVVLVSSPSSVDDILSRFGALIGVRGAALQAFRHGIEQRTGVRIKDVEISERVAALRVPALIVHDRDDREVPFHDAEQLAARWPGATLMATSGLGHRRTLRDEEVLRRAVEFVGSALAGSRAGGRAPELSASRSCDSPAHPLQSARASGSARSAADTS